MYISIYRQTEKTFSDAVDAVYGRAAAIKNYEWEVKDRVDRRNLDQRTFECHWSTVRALAEYKTSGHKIELFYFLPNSWLDRSLAALRNPDKLRDWWGREDWQELRRVKSFERVERFTKRFKEELGYRSVKPWPIFERQDGEGALMYHMIHATDHPEAPKLMSRAYKKAVLPKESQEQLKLELQGFD